MSFLNELGYAGKEYESLPKSESNSVDVVLSAYRTLRGNRRERLAYVGMPITSGKRLYDVLYDAGVRSTEQFVEKYGKQKLRELVMLPNIEEGTRFADMLGVGGERIFITPSIFEARPLGWSQDAYLSLWYRVIGELAGEHHVKDGWEYSTGAVKEVFFSMLLRWRLIRPTTLQNAQDAFGLKNFHQGISFAEAAREFEAMSEIHIFDERRQEIRVDEALKKCVDAIDDLIERGFPYDDLFSLAWRIMQIPILSAAQVAWKEYPHDFANDTYKNARLRLKEIKGD